MPFRNAMLVALSCFGGLFGQSLMAQTPLLRHETLGTGVTDIAESRLDLETRNTYEVDPANLDSDTDTDLVLCQVYLFSPPLSEPATQWEPVLGSGGLRLYYNKTDGPGSGTEAIVGPPFPDGITSLSYHHIKGGLVDLTSSKLNWGIDGFPPSVRDAEITDIDGDGDVDMILACGVEVSPSAIAPHWSRPEQHITQNRILIQSGGVFVDDTFGADGVVGGTGGSRDRLPLSSVSTRAVAAGDLNSDGKIDLLFGDYTPAHSGVSHPLLLGAGVGRFQPAPGNPFAVKPSSNVGDVEFSDLDMDGDLDIVVANANPLRHPVVDTTTTPWSPLDASANIYRDEIWINKLIPGPTFSFELRTPPDPQGLPDGGEDYPYNDPGFWLDTRSVAVGDIDGDGDGDILFANNGWLGAPPDAQTHFLTEPPGQAPQLLLNMGGDQAGTEGLGLNDFLDVADHALPWGAESVYGVLQCPFGGWRAWEDFELTPPGQDIGGPMDLETNPTNPTPDGKPDLLVGIGPFARNDVWINSGDWGMEEYDGGPGLQFWHTKGRFFRGDQQLDPDWIDWPTDNDYIAPWWIAQPSIPVTSYVRLGIFKSDALYTHDVDWVDLDLDGRLDFVTADGDPTRGEINGLYFYRGMQFGFRWLGPADDAAFLPYVNSNLAYDVTSDDIDDDGDVDIVVPGAPTAIVYRNRGGAQGGPEGFFEDISYADTGGILPFTGHPPLFAPILTETAAVFDANGDGNSEMFFGGYPPYASNGQSFAVGDPSDWHLDNLGYHNPITDLPPGPGSGVQVHCNFYVGAALAGTYEDLTLESDGSTPWMDRNGRDYEGISDHVRASDIDNDGDLDLVQGYRPQSSLVHPHISPFNPFALDPSLWQFGLSLWINDGLGHLRDEAVERLGPYSATDPNNIWNRIENDYYEGLAFADIDSDGDLDFILGSTTSLGAAGVNRLFINMGGDQQSAAGGPWTCGEFRAANLPGSPLELWGGVLGPPHAVHNGGWVEAADFDGDDDIDFVMVARSMQPSTVGGPEMAANLLLNDGNGIFDDSDFEGLVVDPYINHGPSYPIQLGAVVPGDFDADGDYDCAVLGIDTNASLLFRNTLSDVNSDGEIDPSDGPLGFEDATAAGTPTGWGTASMDGIAWVEAWSIGGVAGDYDGDGIHDLFVANHSRTTQDDLFISTVTDPVGPWISRVNPATGSISGAEVRVCGVGMSGVDTAWLEQGTNEVTVPAVSTSSREVRFIMPATAPFGPQKLFIGQASAPAERSNQFLLTHLYARPSVQGFTVPSSNQVKFLVTDADGPGLTDLIPGSVQITRQNASGLTTWTYSTFLSAWSYSILPAGGVEVINKPVLLPQPGDIYTLQIKDSHGAVGSGAITY